jgi:FkbM family methyltransferase
MTLNLSFIIEKIYTLLRKFGLFQYIYRIILAVFSTIHVFLISTSDGNQFLPGLGTIEEIYDKKVYDRFFGPKTGQIIVDVGANFGVFSLRSSKVVGKTGQIISIEPEPVNFEVLKFHIKLNKIKNISVYNMALGNKNKSVDLYIGSSHLTHSIKISSNGGKKVTVRMATFDCVMKKENIQSVDLAKIDVEGAEIEVLEGIKDINVKKIVMEYHGKDKIEKISLCLRSRGYTVIIPRSLEHGGELGYVYAYR